MGQGIVKLAEDAYVVWSSVVDAPVSEISSREAMRASGISPLRLARADANGTSFVDENRDGPAYVAFNRAGPREECLTLTALRDRYAPGGDPSAPVRPDEIRPIED